MSISKKIDDVLAGGPALANNLPCNSVQPDAHSGSADSIRAPIERERARNESFRALTPVPISQLGGCDDVNWSWHGYLAREHITLLTALWKCGKTTLVAYLLRDMAAGGELAGTIEIGRVLVISEESKSLWARRRDDLGLSDHVHLINRPFKGRPRLSDWIAFVERIAEWVVSPSFTLVIFDTIASLWPVQDENDAAGVLAAISPLHAITAAGAAVLVVHHPRKGDAGEGQASRGSGALPGFVDIIVELRRYEAANHADRRRVLTSYSRFDETVPEAVIELTDDGYRTIGCKAEAKQSDRLSAIAAILPCEPPGMTSLEVHQNWPDEGIPKPGKRTVQSDLKEGAAKNSWVVTGAGTKGDPYRFRLPENSFRASPIS